IPRRTERESGPRQVVVTFNTAGASRNLAKVWEVLPREAEHLTTAEDWELSPRRLIGQDNQLALAYLRMELDRALVQAAKNHGINVELLRPMGSAKGWAELLAQRKPLPLE